MDRLLRIRKVIASLLGSVVLMTGLGLSAAVPANAAVSSVSVEAKKYPITRLPGVYVGQVKSLKAVRTSSTNGRVSWKTPSHKGILQGYDVIVWRENKIFKIYHTTKLKQKITGLKKHEVYFVTVSTYAVSKNRRNMATNNRSVLLYWK